jgi:decaprenyl-phosphate phosphoribosyltransferase
MRYFFLALRPRQWIKNLILFIPLVFSGNLFHENLLVTSVVGFFLFSFFAGSTYVLNDIRDKDKDMKHPTKSLRPIARGKLHPTIALILSIVLEIAVLYTVYSFF